MSLRARLMLLLGAVWLVVGGAVTLWMFERASAELDAALDSRLAASAAMVARLMAPPLPPLPPSPPASGMVAAIGRPANGGVACEVDLRGGARRTCSPDGPALEAAPLGFGSLARNDAIWRTYAFDSGDLRVITAGRVDIRKALHREMAWTALAPGMAGLLVGIVLLWFGVGRGLAMVEGLRRRLAREEPWLAPDLAGDQVPRELMPFTQTLANRSRRMEEMLRRERHFSDQAAHEMRSPVTAIKAHLQVLQRLPTAARDAASQQAIAHALQGTVRLERLIEQLLVLARADGGEADAACDAVAVLQRVACRKPARVHWRLPVGQPWVALPDALLDCAVRNLVENALKYSPPDMPVEVDASVVADCLVVGVRDYGPGLSAAQCAQATEPFWRGQRQAEGAGLGLSIVATIAARHGGMLALAPAMGGGLHARLTLRLAGGQQATPTNANTRGPETARAGPTPV